MSSENDKPQSPSVEDENPDNQSSGSDYEGKTVAMPHHQSKDKDAMGASSDLSLIDDEATLAMSAYQVEDDGETVLLSDDSISEEDSGPGKNQSEMLPKYGDGETLAMPDYKPKTPVKMTSDIVDIVASPAGDAPSPAGDAPSPAGDAPSPAGDAPSPAGDGPSPAGDGPTIAPTPDLKETDPDLTVVSAGTKRPEVEKPTKASPEPAKTQTNREDARATITNKNKILQGRYRVDKILGQGGFGAAFLAEDIKLRRRCVVKQMLTPNVPPAQLTLYQANFEREASLLAQLNEPGQSNIPEIFDYFTDAKGNNYLVMKFIEGQDLKSILDQNQGPIPWREAIRYVVEICDALDYMHTHGNEPIMHRDIKPANILLGNDNRVWLVDFGLAKADPVESVGDEGTGASLAAGSLGYTPLEQWLGEAVPTSDIYALGATLHHLVTGINPAQAFGGEFSIPKLMELHGSFKPARKIDKNLPNGIEEAIIRATVAEPEQRLTAPQFKQQLEMLTSDKQVTALYTFKSGESAKTVKELVDLCDKYRQEAQEYLYRGEFERWFRMINRNDLAEAAEQAVKQGKNQKDGLQKFLKLVMPNLFLRRLSRAGGRLLRVAVVSLLVIMVTLVVIAIAGSYGAKWFLQQSVSTYPWNFDNLTPEESHRITETQINEGAQSVAGAYFDNLQLDMRPSNKIYVTGQWAEIPFDIPVLLIMQDGKPAFQLTTVNDIPLPLIADNISSGINDGVSQAFQNSPVDITTLTTNDDEVIIEVEKSNRSGRPPLPTATPTATPKPTATTIPSPTPTPEGLALVTIFNETGKDIILDIDGETFDMAIGDSKAIEKKPGTYKFTISFQDTGAVGAEGEKTWTVQTYRWRIGGDE